MVSAYYRYLHRHHLLFLLTLILHCNRVALSKLDTAQLYEELYSTQGYHSNLNITHAEPLVEIIHGKYSRRVEENGVLDIGCSHGRGVELLWEKNISASGMDISRTAVHMAKLNRHDPSWCGHGWTEARAKKCCRGVCFKVGSATEIPFDENEFDAIMTTDVLEHLLPEDVPQMVKEFKRVARSLIFVSVAIIPEKERSYLENLRQSDQGLKFKKVKSLHTTVLNRDSWIKAFEDEGITLLSSQKCKHCSPQVFVFEMSSPADSPRVFGVRDTNTNVFNR